MSFLKSDKKSYSDNFISLKTVMANADEFHEQSLECSSSSNQGEIDLNFGKI